MKNIFKSRGFFLLTLCSICVLIFISMIYNHCFIMGKGKNIKSMNVQNTNNELAIDKDKNEWKYLSVFDFNTKKNILIGMSKDEVDSILGVKTNKDFNNMYNYQGLEVYFRNDKLVAMGIKASSNLTKRYTTNQKIGLGNNRDDIIQVHGKSFEKNNSKFLTYYYQKRGKSLIKVDGVPKITDTSNLYCVAYSLFDNGKISTILICDYQFAMNMK